MGYLKGKSALMMFDRHANLKYKFGNRHFWSEGYYVSTVGLNEATIKKYIQEQEKADIIQDKLSVKEFQLSNKLYAPYNKGGEYRKWYGNRDLVIKFDSVNYGILQNQGNHLPSKQYYFSESATWSALTTSGFSCRYCENGFVFDTKGSSLFCNNKDELLTYMGFLNSIVANEIFKMLSPTVDYNAV